MNRETPITYQGVGKFLLITWMTGTIFLVGAVAFGLVNISFDGKYSGYDLGCDVYGHAIPYDFSGAFLETEVRCSDDEIFVATSSTIYLHATAY